MPPTRAFLFPFSPTSASAKLGSRATKVQTWLFLPCCTAIIMQEAHHLFKIHSAATRGTSLFHLMHFDCRGDNGHARKGPTAHRDQAHANKKLYLYLCYILVISSASACTHRHKKFVKDFCEFQSINARTYSPPTGHSLYAAGEMRCFCEANHAMCAA